MRKVAQILGIGEFTLRAIKLAKGHEVQFNGGQLANAARGKVKSSKYTPFQSLEARALEIIYFGT